MKIRKKREAWKNCADQFLKNGREKHRQRNREERGKILEYEGDVRAREDFQICSCTVASPSLKTLRSFVKINVYQSLLFLLYLEVLEETQRQRERED